MFIKLKGTLIVIFLYFCLFPTNIGATDCPLTPTNLSYHFSPKGGVTKAIVMEISTAKTEVLVQMYVFTSLPIVDALIGAKNRGVNVIVLVDDSALTSKGSKVGILFNALIPVFVDKSHSIAHNKIMIVDKKILITGSFNYSASAEATNAENILVIKRNYCVVNGYIKNFENHKVHSEFYGGVVVGKFEGDN